MLTDFDGTLSAIGPDPAATVALPGAVEALRACTSRFAVCAVLSGRPASFLLGVLGHDVHLSALYGLESVEPGTGGRVDVVPAASSFRAVAGTAADEIEAAAPPGVRVERKGLSLTVHYREAPSAQAWVAATVAGVAAGTELEVHEAKRSYELRPALRVDKGTVVNDLAGALGAVCYLGDDVGDLPAFAALDALHERGVATLKVVVASDEAAPAVLAAADLVLDSPAAAVALLRRLGGLSA